MNQTTAKKQTIIEVHHEPEITSFDARKLLSELRESSQFPEEATNIGRRTSIYEAIRRLAYDADTRHLIRAIAAKGFLPFYADRYVKMYIQVFGFERQNLMVSQINRHSVAEALVANMYAAADHIYWALSSLSDDVLKLLEEDYFDTLITLDSILILLNTYANRILGLEKLILADRKVMQDWSMQDLFSGGINFSKEITDRSYRNNPHWTDFKAHFQDQCERLVYAINQIGAKRYSKYRYLCLLVSKLGPCAAEMSCKK